MKLSFKQFQANKKPAPAHSKATVQESTIGPYHVDEAGFWDHHSEVSNETYEKMSKAFGGKDFTHFPLTQGTHSSVDPDVGEHLANHGYDIKDYKAGIATKKTIVGNPDKGIPHREKIVQEKIGSVLDKTNAPDHVKKAYVNDPGRTSFKSASIAGGHHVVISTHPHAIAGMSTGTSWTSCTNMDDGSNRHFLRNDSEAGTHVAYLVPHDDPTAFKTGVPSKPIARILLKAHHTREYNGEPEDTIYRQESKAYGSAGDSFHHAVNSWATQHYPAKPDVEYHKDEHLYNDDGVDTYKAISHNHVEERLKAGESIYEDRKKPALDHDVINHAVNVASDIVKSPTVTRNEKVRVVKYVTDIPNLNSQHVAKIRHATKQTDFGDYNIDYGIAVTHGDKLSSQAIQDMYVDHPDNSVPNRVLMNPKVPDAIIDNLHPNKYSLVLRSKLKPHHYDKLVDNVMRGDGSVTIREHADYLSHSHLKKLITDNRYLERNSHHGMLAGYPQVQHYAIVGAKNFDQDHHDLLVKTHKEQSDSLGDNMDIKGLKTVILSNSKFASHTDLTKLGKYSGHDVDHHTLMHNPHISVDTQKHLASKFIEKVKSSPEPTTAGSMANDETSNGYRDKYVVGQYHPTVGMNQARIPANISKHFSDSDYAEIAKKGKIPELASPEHSAKLLGAYHAHAKVHDKIMDDHISHSTQKADENGEDYHEDDDETATPKRKAFHEHMSRYATAILEHLTNHVRNDDDGIKNYKAFDQVDNHLDHVDNLEHYKTENNSDYGDDHDHHADHFGEIASSHHDLKMRND